MQILLQKCCLLRNRQNKKFKNRHQNCKDNSNAATYKYMHSVQDLNHHQHQSNILCVSHDRIVYISTQPRDNAQEVERPLLVSNGVAERVDATVEQLYWRRWEFAQQFLQLSLREHLHRLHHNHYMLLRLLHEKTSGTFMSNITNSIATGDRKAEWRPPTKHQTADVYV